ncbi:MAG TPA: hypothetical protein VHN13_14910 [Candidatus Tectomicrobia bacterium]|nr:hypothetical protein [Candidatus Tectomicrobia bacterium]
MAEAAKSDFGHDNAIATAKVLALTVCDLLAHPDLVAAAKADFAARAR